MAFVDKLIEMNRGDFLGGLGKLGKAVKEKEQQDTLVEQWNRFKLKRDDLLTTHEQAAELSKDFLKESEKPADVEMTANIFEHLQRNIEKIDALTGLYQPFITSFATLGEDGIKVAERLTNELATKVMIEEKRGDIPFQGMEYKAMVQQYKFDESKIKLWHETVDRESRLRNVQDATLSSGLWKNIVKTKANFNTNAGKVAMLEWKSNVENIKKEMVAKFPELNPNDIGIAVESMIAQYDRGLSTEEFEPRTTGTGTGLYDPFAIDMAASFAQQFTAEFNSLGNGLKEALRVYQTDGYIPTKVMNPVTGKDEDIDPKRINKLISKANQFMKAQEILNHVSGYQWFNRAEGEVNLGVDKEGKPKTTKMQIPTFQLRGQDTGNIMRVRTLPDLFNMRFDYNPYQKQRILGQQGEGQSNLNEGNLIKGNKRDFANEVVNVLYDDLDSGFIVDFFEEFINSGYEDITGERLKTTREIRQGKK